MPAPIFTAEHFSIAVNSERLDTFNQVWQRLSEPGYWWTASERQAIASACRASKPRNMLDRDKTVIRQLSNTPSAAALLSPLCLHVVDKISANPGDISTDWAQYAIDELGEGAYAEIIGVIILLLPIDLFCRYLGSPLMALPTPKPGPASKIYPDDLRDNGAWIRQAATAINNPELVNVSRAISIIPKENELRRALVDALYMEGHSFFATTWENKSISRQQLEIIATRTSAINKCFYCATGHSAIFDIVAKANHNSQALSLLVSDSENTDSITSLLLEITESINRDPDSAPAFHQQILQHFDPQGLIEIFSTIAIFNGLNRTSDPSGVPLEDVLVAAMGDKIDRLGLDSFNGHTLVTRPGSIKRLIILVSFKLRKILGGKQ